MVSGAILFRVLSSERRILSTKEGGFAKFWVSWGKNSRVFYKVWVSVWEGFEDLKGGSRLGNGGAEFEEEALLVWVGEF